VDTKTSAYSQSTQCYDFPFRRMIKLGNQSNAYNCMDNYLLVVSCTLQVKQTFRSHHVQQNLRVFSSINSMAHSSSTTNRQSDHLRWTESQTKSQRRWKLLLAGSEREQSRRESPQESTSSGQPSNTKKMRWSKVRHRPRRNFTVNKETQTDLTLGTGKIRLESIVRIIADVRPTAEFNIMFGRVKDASTSPCRLGGQSRVPRLTRETTQMNSICSAMKDLCTVDDNWGLESNIGWD
jgi:hypothetical protein